MSDQIKSILLENLNHASGGRGLDLKNLHRAFYYLKDNEVHKLIQTLKTAYEQYGVEWLDSNHLIECEYTERWFEWRHIEERYDLSWGFPIKSPGCYLYGFFKDSPPPKIVDPLSENIIYIGQSSSISRNGMINRRSDFKSNIKRDLIRDYSGNSVLFKKHFDREDLKYVYQAYLPLAQKKCKIREMKLFCEYYEKYDKLPILNYKTDLEKVKREYSNYIMWKNLTT